MKKKNTKKGRTFKTELLQVKEMMDLVQQRVSQGHQNLDKVLSYLKDHLEKLWKIYNDSEERVGDLEVQVNLLTRLVTTICLESLGMRLSEFRRLIRRMEKEAEEDSEIAHLETLYSLEPKNPTHHKLHLFNQKRPKHKPKHEPPIA